MHLIILIVLLEILLHMESDVLFQIVYVAIFVSQVHDDHIIWYVLDILVTFQLDNNPNGNKLLVNYFKQNTKII